MPYQFGSILLLATLVAGPLFVDPPAPEATLVVTPSTTSVANETLEGPTAPTPSDADLEVSVALATPRPTEWMSKVRRCHRRGGRRFCDGPRMVALPTGQAVEVAEALELGDTRTASLLLWQAPREDWVEAVGSEGTDDLLFPVQEGRMGRGFGFVRRSELRHIRHDGVDIPAAIGSAVRAVDDGIVAYADNGVSGFGNLVLIVHGDGGTSLYAHLRASYFFAGQRVVRGQTIGEVGTTGLSRAPHLHFEYRRNGRLTDPVPHFVDLPERVQADLDTRSTRRARRAHRRAAHAHDHG
jgi:murein DD-endopeptidase MepM/ murein hydrolase activator NlpD